MDENKGEATAESKELAKQQSNADGVGAAVALAFPTSFQDPTPILAPLRDKHSNYAAVAKTCLHLNQFALNGSSSALDDTSSGVAQSTLLHDPSLAGSLNGAFASLIECLQTHMDRRAKILCCQTLAIVARSTYARLRHSPQLFALRESTNSRLEDEVGTDIPMALVGAALEDTDDGVAASALQALGILCLSSGATTGTMVEDELWREITSMVQQRPSPYSPTLADVEDEESYIPQVELQTRILENVISPRLLQLVWRVVAFEQDSHVGMILPVLTTSLVHLSKTSVTLYTMNRETYAKRWVELDFVNLVNTVVQVLLLPAMQSTKKGQVAHAAAMSAVRLVHICPQASWVNEVCKWATLVLQEELSLDSVGIGPSLESTMTNLSSLLICARAVPLPERMSILSFCFDKVRTLPSTTVASYGIHTAGLLLEAHGMWHYRRPARVALLAEIALSFFIDGPIDSSADAKNPRSSSLDSFMKSNAFAAAIKEIQKGKAVQFREEVALAFCMVATGVGRRHKDAPEYSSDASPNPSSYGLAAPKDDFSEWARMSVMVLNTFNSCLGWGRGDTSSQSYMEEDLSLLVATQASYMRLVQELVHAVGLLPSTSVMLKMAPVATPPHILWDQIEESAEFLGQYDCNPINNQGILDKVGKALDQCIKKELKGEGITNHHLRIFLLALTADQWVQARYIATKKEFEGKVSGPANVNASSATDLLQALSPRRMFAKVVEDQKNHIEAYPKKKKDLYKKYAQDTVTICVACIENIALTASDWRKRFGNSADVKSIFNAAIASLQGLGPNGEVDPHTPVLPVCQGAIERVQAAFGSNDQPSIDHLSLSPLLLNAPDLRRRPAVTASRSTQGKDSYNEGYLMQLSRLIVAARIDRCVLGLPAVSSLRGAVRKQNWLRLALPPLPLGRNPQVPISALPKFSWGSGVSAPLGGSDAAAMTLAYSVRRNMRYDGENEFRLMVTMRVHNITAVEVAEGMRLSLGLLQEAAATSLDGQDPVSIGIMNSLNEDGEEFMNESTLSSATSLYKLELNSGDHLTWEVMMDPLPMTGAIRLQPAVEYRAMEDEAAHSTWIGVEAKDGDEDDSSAVSGMSQKSLSNQNESENKENEQKLNITIPGEEMKLSPMVGLQPCPLVFFRDGCGDVDTFRFLWSRMPFQITPLKIAPESNGASIQVSFDTLRLAALSMVKFQGNAIPGGDVTKLWAFLSLSGKRVLFVLAESAGDSRRRGPADKTIHVRGDDKQLLCCLTGTASARTSLVAALLPGMRPL